MKTIVALFLACLCTVVHAQTLSLGLGQSVSNSLNDEHSVAWMISQGFPVSGLFRIQVGYLNEGHQRGSKRDGITILGAYRNRFTSYLHTEAYLGAYITSTTEATSQTTYEDVYRPMLIAGYGVQLSPVRRAQVRFTWLHVMSFINQDSDVFLASMTWRD